MLNLKKKLFTIALSLFCAAVKFQFSQFFSWNITNDEEPPHFQWRFFHVRLS